MDRRVRFRSGRVVVGGSSPAVGPVSPVTREHGPDKSQGPSHGQGIGLGLYLLTIGSKPPGQQHGPVGAAPTMRNSVKTAAASTGGGGSSPQSYVVTLPTYHVGDVVLLHVLWESGSLGGPLSPAGWTAPQARRQAGSSSGLTISAFVRVMNGTEGTTVTVQENSFSGANASAAASSWQGASASPVAASSSGSSSGANVSTWTGGAVTIATSSPCAATAMVAASTASDFTLTGGATLAYDYLDSSGIVGGVSNWRFGLPMIPVAAAGTYTLSGAYSPTDSTRFGAISLALQGA